MEILDVKIGDLHPYESNPRKNDAAIPKVMASIEKFGFKIPIVIDKNNVIVCGHTRYRAAKKLKMKSVPCIIADDLSDEQIKAFRLADNKVAEYAEWDFDLLDAEMEKITDIDMENFGFEFDYVDEEEEKQKTKEAVQHRVENIENLGIAQLDGTGYYDIPIIKPVTELPEIKEWIGFNYVLSDTDPAGKAVHFFIDDYQFQRLWNNPEKYVEKLKQYVCVAAPDFSPYGDMPLILQLYNHYRKHWVAAYLQSKGVTVIPTIRSSTDPRSFDWYLEGEPSNGIVMISSMWTSKKEEFEIFKKEYETMVAKLNPKKIFVYGYDKYGDLPGNKEFIDSFARKRWK